MLRTKEEALRRSSHFFHQKPLFPLHQILAHYVNGTLQNHVPKRRVLRRSPFFVNSGKKLQQEQYNTCKQFYIYQHYYPETNNPVQNCVLQGEILSVLFVGPHQMCEKHPYTASLADDFNFSVQPTNPSESTVFFKILHHGSH